MRGRRLLADAVDLTLALPLAVPVGYAFFGVGTAPYGAYPPRFYERHVEPQLESMLERLISLPLMVVSLAAAWAMVFVLFRANTGPTAGELVAGLKPGPGEGRLKTWLWALCLVDLPLGWVLGARPVERALGLRRERDHTRTFLEAVGNAWRKKPGALFLVALLVVTPFASFPMWASMLERHHKFLFNSTIAEYDQFCGQVLSTSRGRAVVRAIANAETLAPELWRNSLFPGSRERASLDAALAVLDGPCGRLEPGAALPDGSTDEPRPAYQQMLLLSGDRAQKSGACWNRWRNNYSHPGQPYDETCGEFRMLGSAYSTRLPNGGEARCGVYAHQGRITAVVGECAR